MVPAGKKMSVLGSGNGVASACLRPSLQTGFPALLPGKWAAPRLASQVPVPSWSMTWLVLQSQTGSWGQQLPVLTQRAAVLLSRAGGHTGNWWGMQGSQTGGERTGTFPSQVPAVTHKLWHRGSAFKASLRETHSSKMMMRLNLFK